MPDQTPDEAAAQHPTPWRVDDALGWIVDADGNEVCQATRGTRAPLLPWPELSQDMAFIAFTIRDLRARLAAQQPVIDAAQVVVRRPFSGIQSSTDMQEAVVGLAAALATYRSAAGSVEAAEVVRQGATESTRTTSVEAADTRAIELGDVTSRKLAEVIERECTAWRYDHPDGEHYVQVEAVVDVLANYLISLTWPGEETEPTIADLIERSSLGTPEAKAARARVSDERAAQILARVAELAVEAADTPPSGTSGHEAGAPAEPETHHANRFGHPVYVGDDWAVEQWSSGEIKVSVSDHRDPPGGQTYYFEPDLAAAIGAAAREVAGTPAAEPDWKRREHGIRTALYGTSEEVRAALVARAAEVHGQDIPAPAAEPAPAPARTGELERLRIKHREFVDVQMAQYAGEPDDLADLFPVAAEPAPDVEQAPHFGHTQDVIEDALVGAGFQDLPHLRDIVFVATEAARDALGVCQVCGSGQPGMYPSDPSADGYAGPEECSACDGTGWARALAGAGAPTEPADTQETTP